MDRVDYGSVSKTKKKSALPRIGFAMFGGMASAALALTALTRIDSAAGAPWGPEARNGNLLPLFKSGDFWSAFPTFAADAAALAAALPMILALCVVVVCTIVMRRLLHRSWSAVGLSILVIGGAPLIAGGFGAFAGNSPSDLSSWLAILVVTPLHCAVVCCLCAVLDVVMPNATEKRSVKSRPATA